jgi:ribosomal protein L16/L10AE
MSFESTRSPVLEQTGSREVYGVPLGKPQDIVDRVHIGQIIISICTKLQNKKHVIEALCMAKFKFPGPRRSTSQRCEALSLMKMNLWTW